MEIGKPSLNQISFLENWLRNNYHIDQIFDWSDADNVYERLSRMSYGQYQMMNRGRREKINNILLSLGFKIIK